jgi:hypothetical protein
VTCPVDEDQGTYDVIYDDDAEEDGVSLSRLTPAPTHLLGDHHNHHTMSGACYANLARCLLRLHLPAAAAAAATHALHAGTSMRVGANEGSEPARFVAADCVPGHTEKPPTQR